MKSYSQWSVEQLKFYIKKKASFPSLQILVSSFPKYLLREKEENVFPMINVLQAPNSVTIFALLSFLLCDSLLLCDFLDVLFWKVL